MFPLEDDSTIHIVGDTLVHKILQFRFRRPLALAALMVLCLFTFAPLAGSAQSRDLYWDEYNTTIDLHEDGSFTVTEQQVITFEGGPFSQGFAQIPLNRVEDITNIQVSEDGQPYQRGTNRPGTYSAQIYGGTLEILWFFGPVSNETLNFTIQYDVIGGLRVYTSETGAPREQLWWRPIDTDFTATVNEATVTLSLPQPVNADEMVATSYYIGDRAEPTVEMTDPQTIVWHDAGPIEPGDALEIRTEFPKMTTATVPGWQAADDAQRAEEERLRPYKSAANLTFIAAGLGLLVIGPLGIYALWRRSGRDFPVEMPIDILREPPDDLSPGAVGTLVDEQADDHDVIAMIVDLAERGVIEINEEEPDVVVGASLPGRSWKIRKTGKTPDLRGSEQALLNALFESESTNEVSLHSVRTRFASKQKDVKNKLYQELHEAGYFPGNPEATRRKWLVIGGVAAVLSVCVGFLLAAFVLDFAGWVILPIVVAVLLSLALLGLSGSMPKKTQKGAEAAAKWLAFKRYLEQIQQYDDLEQAKDIFAKYLPYAVAFRLERSWVRKFEQVNTPAPEWYGPLPRRIPRRRGRWGGPVIIGVPGGGAAGGGMPDVDIPDLQDMSEGLGGGLQDMSDGLFGMFNEASEIFEPFSTSPGSSGKGNWGRGMTFGGGGFSGGGFGGGGFGGGFGGGGGGGGRGFS